MSKPTTVKDEPQTKKAKHNDDSTPSYGSQEYWDSRYKKVKEKKDTKDDAKEDDDEAQPYHSWYFTYADLRPLILPLILGERVNSVLFDENSDKNETPADEDQYCQVVDAATNANGEGALEDGHTGSTSDKEPSEGRQNEGSDVDDDQKGESSDEDAGEIDDGEEVEIEEEEEDDDGEPPSREGVAKDGPISVLEIGCGDVPLGKDLAIDLIQLEKSLETELGAITKRIVCFDYSPTVVALMTKQKLQVEGVPVHRIKALDATIDFQTEDARKMSYEDKSFEIILEKGTMDALLSDQKVGTANCQAVMAESSRVLTKGGYIILISHLNAHTDSGIQWLNEVVVEGLRAGDKDAVWEIEAHGNDDFEESEEERSSPQLSPGPCVYIIHKMLSSAEPNSKSDDSDSPSNIQLKFFTY